MSKGNRYLVVTYYAFNDPLFQGLLWRIVSQLKKPEDEITLVTLEHKRVEDIQTEILREQNVHWKPISFAYGGAIGVKKAWMMLRVQFILFSNALLRRPNKIFSSGSLAASLCWPVTSITGLQQVVYAFEPHSEFLLDQGKISASSLSFKVLQFFEKRVMYGHSVIMTGTRAMKQRIEQLNPKAEVHLLPTNADEELFVFSDENRTIIRERLGVSEKRVITYVGKFGDLYLGKELIAFFAELSRLNDQLFFLILTPNNPRELASWFDGEDVSSDRYWIGSCPLQELPSYLSAADFGVVAYADFPSRKYTSPTKSGNYLLCGLPYLIQENTSDDDRVVAKNNVGVVIKNFDRSSAANAYQEMEKLWGEEPQKLRERCRTAGVNYRGMSNALSLYKRFF